MLFWRVKPLDKILETAGKRVVRHDGRQILLLKTPAGLFATVNRCPHESYPLREGSD